MKVNDGFDGKMMIPTESLRVRFSRFVGEFVERMLRRAAQWVAEGAPGLVQYDAEKRLPGETVADFHERVFQKKQRELHERRANERATLHEFPICETCLRTGPRENCEACVNLLVKC